ncbi:hypothetical protein M9H77_09877 [Catharanthus roseus]|uniref:Uncharacterized protein n=1 Tax=Catharanthus roseus TaxID=4058 RepID=A0ACC0C268_CATRO|nr:hypothetical protein M9H77_09877 [Catharanthus roseus]
MDNFEDYLHYMINFEGRKKKVWLDDDDEDIEEEVPVKLRGSYGVKKYKEEEDEGTSHDRKTTSSIYNMMLFKAVGMTPTRKTFIVKDNDKSNPVIAQLCYNVSHLALRIIKEEIKRASNILADPENLCRHWVRTSYILPCSCELFKRYQIFIPLKLEDFHIFWRSLEINGLSRIGGQQSHDESDLQKQLLNFIGILQEFSTQPPYEFMELRRATQNILHHIIPLNPEDSVFEAPHTVITKGRHKIDSPKRDKSHWEHIQIAHARMKKSSEFGRDRVLNQGLV